MNPPTPVRTEPLFLRNSISLAVLLALFGFSPVRAQLPSPTPDGGYPNGNTAEGEEALLSVTIGSANTAIGFHALRSNTDGSGNTANGSLALLTNTTGNDNTATGFYALLNNTTGGANTANGSEALTNNTTGNDNTATGFQALSFNTTGNDNTANGAGALISNTSGNSNTANGSFALRRNGTGNYNTANGTFALAHNIAGTYNPATGVNALLANTAGNGNTANGVQTLQNNTTGIGNTATGVNALVSNTTGNNNAASGRQTLYNNTTGSNNIALGTNAGSNLTVGSNNIDIGNQGIADESSAIRIGTAGAQTATFIAGIRGTTTANGNAVPVVIDSAGQLGTVSSSQRFKDDVKPMDNASEAIMALKPVTFHYKTDKEKAPQFGLIAEDVAKVNPDLVVRDEKDEIYTVRYDAVNAMLLNEFLKEHGKVQELEKQVAALTAGLQKVTAELATRRGAFSIVLSQK